NGQIVSRSKTLSLSTGTLGEYSNAYNMLSPVNYHNIAVRYIAPVGTTIGADYTCYSENRSQSLYRENDLLLNSDNRQYIDRYHLFADQEHQIGKWQINYGVEYQYSKDHSSQKYLTSNHMDFNNTLNEDVVGIYVGAQRTFDWGLSFNASAKGEYFHNNYQHNWNLIPQLGTTYYKTPKSIFQLNLSSQRIYPSYWELHGATNYINDYSYIVGNPALQPYINYSSQLNYIYRQKYVATLYFQYDDKATVQLPYQSPDSFNLIYQTINMEFKRTLGLNIYAPVNIGYVWNATINANIFNRREKACHFHDISFDNSKWIFYGSLSNTLKFSQNCPISLTIDFTYISPSLQGIADLSSIWRIDAGAKWQFGKKCCCELDLKVDDLFNRWSPTMTINNAGQNYVMKVKDMTRNLKLTFIWRFNGIKPNNATIDTSRFGTGE
ncbi:MAG: outer membrane beta-barrel family protein, partial [Muribaculaceae bacterium]|nr:outer membrane beta-barrel family protein [Muribaculaceae bacterium]